MADKEFLVKFKMNPNNLNARSYGEMKLDQIRDMVIPEFIEFQGRIVNLSKYRRYDTAYYKGATAITPANAFSLFRLGVGEQTSFANDPADLYVKTAAHTNMMKDGEWQPGELAIIHQIEAKVLFTAGVPTTQADGTVSAPAATFSATEDIFLLLDIVNTQFGVQFLRGGNRQVIVDGVIEDFPMLTGLSGSGGSSATWMSGFAQNMGFGDQNLLVKPQVIEGKEDFEFLITPLAPTLTIPGAQRQTTIRLRLSTWEFLRYYA